MIITWLVGTARLASLNHPFRVSVIKDPLPEEGAKPADFSHALIEQVDEALRTGLEDLLASCVSHVAPARIA
jgi:hypothetical protein